MTRSTRLARRLPLIMDKNLKERGPEVKAFHIQLLPKKREKTEDKEAKMRVQGYKNYVIRYLIND